MKLAAALILTVALVACGRSSAPAESTSGSSSDSSSAAPATAWSATDGISAPESIYFDPASGFIFSSQIEGASDAKDGNGRIVQMDRNGKLVNANFVTGLNAPKGLRACDGTLWTADIDEVIGIDVASGDIKSRIMIPDARFLNDVACAGTTVYVTDMMANRIYSVSNGTVAVVAEGDLEFPNGLLVDGTRLIVGGWGSQPKADFSTDTPGHLYAYDLGTKQKTLITQSPTANIDGVESDGKGGYFISDFLSGRIMHVSASGETRLIRQLKQGTADIGFVPESNLLLVPQMNDNQVAAYDVATDLTQ